MADYVKVHENTIPLVQFAQVAKKQKLRKQQHYDPHASPPNFNLAIEHGQAVRVSEEDPNDLVRQTCPCCGLRIVNIQFPLDVELKHIAFLGVTFPLYFQFIKKCALLFTLQFFSCSFYNLMLNVDGDGCIASGSGFVCNWSVLNVLQAGGNNLTIQGIHNLLTLVLLIIMIEFFKVNQEQSRYEMEKHRITPSDFTLQVSGFNRNSNSEDVQRILHRCHPNIEICGIYFLLDMECYSKLYKSKLQLIRQKNVYKAKEKLEHKFYSQEIASIDNRLYYIHQKLKRYESTVQENTFTKIKVSILTISDESAHSEPDEFTTLQFSGRVFVTLNSAHDCKQIVNKFTLQYHESVLYWMYRRKIFTQFCKNHLKRFTYDNNVLRIKRAAEPSDVNWMNVGSSKITFKLWANIAIIIIFAISFLIIWRIKVYIKKKQQESFQNNEIITIGLSLIVSTMVALTNTIIGFVIRKFAGSETHKKQTNYFVSVGKRLSYLFFINMVMTTLFANFFDRTDKDTNHFGENSRLIGMLDDYFFLFITNTYLSSIFNYFDIMWGVRLFKRQQALTEDQNSSLSQAEANNLFEGHPVDMALRYANVLKVMFFTAAVSPLLPIGLPMSIFGLFILYKVDKYLLLRRYVSKNYLDSQLANEMMNILPLYTVFFSIGNLLVFFLSGQQKADTINWSDINFYLAFLAFIGCLIYRYLFSIDYFKKVYAQIFAIKTPEKIIDEDYHFYKPQFVLNYEQYHPVLKEYSQEQEKPDDITRTQANLFKHIKVSLQQ